MNNNAASRARSSDAIQLDRFPACPNCGDLLPQGARICMCGTRLVPYLNESGHRLTIHGAPMTAVRSGV